MLATECARVLGYRDSYLLFNKNRSLYKIIANQQEKGQSHSPGDLAVLIPIAADRDSHGAINVQAIWQPPDRERPARSRRLLGSEG